MRNGHHNVLYTTHTSPFLMESSKYENCTVNRSYATRICRITLKILNIERCKLLLNVMKPY
jgi:hypothetical protein